MVTPKTTRLLLHPVRTIHRNVITTFAVEALLAMLQSRDKFFSLKYESGILPKRANNGFKIARLKGLCS